MSQTHASTPNLDEPGLYEIRIQGHLDDRRAAWFEGLALTREDNGDTLLTGLVVDQAALHGLLRKVRDLGMTLISVSLINPSRGDTAQTTANADNCVREYRRKMMKITASNLIRWAGLAALVAGLIFAGIQPIHPADEVASVTTRAWAIITPLKTVMALLFLVGITGLYARQVKETSWLGLAGWFLFSLSWALNFAFIFAETYILPPLASTAPEFVDGVLGISYGKVSTVDLGILPELYSLLSVLFLLGGLLIGIAAFRAAILPRWAGGLLALSAALTPLAALLPHHLQRLAGIPIGLAVAWLGYALLTERREMVSQPLPGRGRAQIYQTGND